MPRQAANRQTKDGIPTYVRGWNRYLFGRPCHPQQVAGWIACDGTTGLYTEDNYDYTRLFYVESRERKRAHLERRQMRLLKKSEYAKKIKKIKKKVSPARNWEICSLPNLPFHSFSSTRRSYYSLIRYCISGYSTGYFKDCPNGGKFQAHWGYFGGFPYHATLIYLYSGTHELGERFDESEIG